jgi:hypothetical protein
MLMFLSLMYADLKLLIWTIFPNEGVGVWALAKFIVRDKSSVVSFMF